MDNKEELEKDAEELSEIYDQVITAWAKTIDDKSNYTKEHSNKVRKCAEAMGKRLYLSAKEMKVLTAAAMLHDIGKYNMDNEILNKKGELTQEEYEMIKGHSVKGAEIIGSMPLLKEIGKVIRYHHERYDGQGYPDGLKDEDIPYLARILGVAEAFDAMTSERPYKPRMSLSEAILELEVNSGTQFDPEAVDALVHILKASPDIMN
ncbi:MAG: HD-GYP domain-containing protein [bacterium]|nr:HD-GYP domain-containing protein [bacterium]